MIKGMKPGLLILLAGSALAQNPGQAPPRPPAAPPSEVAGIHVNYDESQAGSYVLPDPLALSNGWKVGDAKTWFDQRRPELVRLFEENEYGRAPGRPAGMSFDVFDKGTPAFEGKAIRRQVTVYFSRDKTGPKLDLLLYVPANASKPVPVLVQISFSANSTAVDDPGVKPGEVWGRDKKRIPAPKAGFGRLDVPRPVGQGLGV